MSENAKPSKVSLLQVFKTCLQQKKFVNKKLSACLGGKGGMMFEIYIEKDSLLAMIGYEDKVRFYFRGILQDYPPALFEELVNLFDKTHLVPSPSVEESEAYLIEKLGTEIINNTEGQYFTTEDIAELIYLLSIEHIVNIPDFTDKNPERIYYKDLKANFPEFIIETVRFSDKEIIDFNHLAKNINSYDSVFYEKDGSTCEKKLRLLPLLK